MNKSISISWVARNTLSLTTVITLVACSAALPPATPEAIGLAGDRIVLNAVAAHTALTNLIDNAEISRDYIKAADEQLRQIGGCLSGTNKSRFQEALELTRPGQ